MEARKNSIEQLPELDQRQAYASDLPDASEKEQSPAT
jgi:hypothetical protein